MDAGGHAERGEEGEGNWGTDRGGPWSHGSGVTEGYRVVYSL